MMIELDVFYSQLSSIMEGLVKSAVADIGKLMEDYTASILEISRCRAENEVTKSNTKLTDDRSRPGSQNEFTGARDSTGKRQESVHVRNDQETVQLQCDVALYQNRDKDMTGQTTSQQHVSGWTDLRLSPETFQQLQVCAQAHTSSTPKEEYNRHLPCSIKQETQVEDTIVLTPPAPDGSWSEGQPPVCSIKMERRNTCMQSSVAEDGADSSGAYGILLQHPLSPLQSGHQVEPEGRGSSSDLESERSTDSHMGTLDNPLPDHFLHSLSYCDANPSQNYSVPPMDFHHAPAEKASLLLGFTADHGGGEVGVAAGAATQRPNGSDKQRRYACKYCEQGFPYLSQLKRHMPKHTKERPYCCGICGFSFMRMSHLKRHERSHTGDRPYACEECRRCFIRKSHLDQHLKTHRRVEPQHSPLPF